MSAELRVKPFSVNKIWVPTVFTEFGMPPREEMNLAGCENCEVSPRVLNATRGLAPQLFIDHWESQDKTLRHKLAQLHDVKQEQVFLTSGALAGIRYVFDIFVEQGANVGLLRPDFPGFLYFSERARANTRWLANTEYPFSITGSTISQFVHDEKIDFLITSSPSAVTGTRRSSEEVQDLVESAPNTMFVVDEADAIDTSSNAILTKQYDNLIILRSFSKFYGLSGVRIGYLVTPEVYSDHFERTINPIELASVAILAATEVLDDIEYQVRTQSRVRQNLALLEAATQNTPYNLVPGSKCFATYLGADADSEDPSILLQRYGIRILEGSNFGIERGGRINISSTDNVTRLVEVINREIPLSRFTPHRFQHQPPAP